MVYCYDISRTLNYFADGLANYRIVNKTSNTGKRHRQIKHLKFL